MNQKSIKINKIKLPIIEEDNQNWYPITFLSEKILLKILSPHQLKKNGYDEGIRQYQINFGGNTGGIQKTYCISENTLKDVLSNSKLSRLNIEQKKAMKSMCRYLNLDIKIDFKEKFLDYLSEETWKTYDFWSSECIEEFLIESKNLCKWQMCNKCGKYYPYDEHFYEKEGDSILRSVCKSCKIWTSTKSKGSIQNINKEYQYIYRKLGKKIYLIYKSKNIYEIWRCYKTHNIPRVPKILLNKNNLLILLKQLYDLEILKYNMINLKDIKNLVFNINLAKCNLSEVYNFILGFKIDDKIGYGISNFDEAKILILNYVKTKDIIIDYNTDLWKLIKEVGLITFVKKEFKNDILEFLQKVYDYKFIDYKFVGYSNHWINQNIRNRALRYFIEDDLKIPINKIPLYLTLENIRKNSKTMRNILKKYYNNNIYAWVNEVYPFMYIEQDFNISIIRHVFDSAEEHLINDYLKSKYKNVIYNQRNTDNTIIIKNMIPDWFIVTDNGIYLIEYFGISSDQKPCNNRIIDYQNKIESKMDKYKDIKWLTPVYIYPRDIKDNFKLLEDKLKSIV